MRLACDDTARAVAQFREGLGLFLETDRIMLSEDAERTARLYATAESIRAAIGAPLPPVDRPAYERDVAAAPAHLGEAAFSQAWAQGQTEPYQAVGAQIVEITADAVIPGTPGPLESSA